jgi:hypothetical protein
MILSKFCADSDRIGCLTIISLYFQYVERKYIAMLVQSNSLVDYIEAVLLDEKSSLNIQLIYNFLFVYFPKVRVF